MTTSALPWVCENQARNQKQSYGCGTIHEIRVFSVRDRVFSRRPMSPWSAQKLLIDALSITKIRCLVRVEIFRHMCRLRHFLCRTQMGETRMRFSRFPCLGHDWEKNRIPYPYRLRHGAAGIVSGVGLLLGFHSEARIASLWCSII